MNMQDLKNELFKDKSFKKYFEKNKLSYEIATYVMESRISRGFSQEKLAKKAGTKQSSIARLERGIYLPSLRFLDKIAKALDTELIAPKLKLLEDNKTSSDIIDFLNNQSRKNLSFVESTTNSNKSSTTIDEF